MERQMRLWLEALTRCVLFVLGVVCLALFGIVWHSSERFQICGQTGYPKHIGFEHWATRSR